ncbi:DUF6325 family protein [Rhodococcus sp. HNM0569]|uniref:DUF6325 family protein n=1 Tax=Rhodococcus sp. HNM0569 TaxID=2716340 RepID=UPI001469C158|nr:DUF6325 family protein [Rhodococcus sp. HNM0569]NLU83172.1 DUF1269 domain-containing protein [Rhodococcus sp. HNM0569]
MSTDIDIGPVELVVLSFPAAKADPAAIAELRTTLANGDATLLDLVFVSKDADGTLTEFEASEGLDGTALAGLEVDTVDLISDDDLEIIRDGLAPGTSAAVLVYEQTWARRLATAVRAAGGEVDLHVQVPHDAAVAAYAAARQPSGGQA